MNRQHGNIYMIQCGQIPDVPIIVIFLALPIMFGKPNLGILPCYENTSENGSAHCTSHLQPFPLKRWHSSVLMRSGLLHFHIMHHYSEQVSYQQLQLLQRRLELNTGSFLFILHALFLQGFLHISFFVRLRIGYIAKAL